MSGSGEEDGKRAFDLLEHVARGGTNAISSPPETEGEDDDEEFQVPLPGAQALGTGRGITAPSASAQGPQVPERGPYPVPAGEEVQDQLARLEEKASGFRDRLDRIHVDSRLSSRIYIFCFS